MEQRATSESERSIAAVRCVLALLGASLVLGNRMGDDGGVVSLPSIAIAVAVITAPAMLWPLPGVLARFGLGRKATAIVLQALDTVAGLGLAYVAGTVLPDAGWALLSIPIVIASIRLNAMGVLAVWLATSLGYAAMLWADLVAPGREAISTSLVLERPGVLLAVAAGVALLTRWLQAGWVEQAQLAIEAQTRFQHVQTIARAGREMRGRNADEVITTCLHHVVELGFEAASATGADRPLVAVGDGSIVPDDETIDEPDAGVVELTQWDGPNETVYSAAMIEPRSGHVISGWSIEPPGTLQADALSELVAHATSGVELAELFGQARFEADHDSLTGLANRNQFERRLVSLASSEHNMAMLFMDLDHFKQINDRHGHDAGDWALQGVAGVLREQLGELGFVARYGGDEFVAIVAGEHTCEVEAVAQRLLDAVNTVSAHSTVDGGQVDVKVGISIGIALAAGPVDPDEIRHAADQAVFAAKRLGRGQVVTTWVSPTSEPVPLDPPSMCTDPQWPQPAPRPLAPPTVLSELPVLLPAPVDEFDAPVLVGSRP